MLAILLISPQPTMGQANSCHAQVNVTQILRDEDSYGASFKYRIDATTDVPHAVVYFDLRRTFDIKGSLFTQAEPLSLPVHGGSGRDSGEYRESSSPRQIRWSVENVQCKRADSAAPDSGSPDQGTQAGSGDRSTDAIDKQMVGTWKGNMFKRYSKPAGQTIEGISTLNIEQKIGPTKYSGTLVSTYTRTAGTVFKDGSKSYTFREAFRVIVEVSGTTVTVTENGKITSGDKTELHLPVTRPGNRALSVDLVLSGRTISGSGEAQQGEPGTVNVLLTKE
jgi:hypothetical protein